MRWQVTGVRAVLVCLGVSLLAAGCTSPGSVRTLSEGQTARMNSYRTSLTQLLAKAAAEQDLRIDLQITAKQASIAGNQAKLAREQAANPVNEAAVKQLTSDIAAGESKVKELQDAKAQVRGQYQGFLDAFDRLLLEPQVALDAWHHRPGIPDFGSDSIAALAQKLAVEGVGPHTARDFKQALNDATEDLRNKETK